MPKIRLEDIEKDLGKAKQAADQLVGKAADIDNKLDKVLEGQTMQAVDADVADADFSALNKNSQAFEANIATMIYGLDEVTKSFGSEFTRMSEQTSGERIISFFSRKKAAEMRTSRVRSTDIRGNLTQLIAKSTVIQELLSQQLAVIDDRREKTIAGHAKVLDRARGTAAEIDALNGRLDELAPKVSEIQGRLEEATGEQRQVVEEELRVASQAYNDASTKLQSKTAEQQSLTRYAKHYTTYVDSLTKQKAAQETLINKLKIDTEQRTTLYDALAESLRTSTQQDIAHRIDEVGRETDAQAEELMLQVGASSQNKIVGMLEAHELYMKRSQDVAAKGRIADETFQRRFAQVVEKVDSGRYGSGETA